MSTPYTPVRAHPRRGTRGVRQHFRFFYVEENPPIDIRLVDGRIYGFRKGTVASVARSGEPIIELHNPPQGTAPHEMPDAYVRILGHETLHHALQRSDEHRASTMLDEVQAIRMRQMARNLLRTGRYKVGDWVPPSRVLTKSGLHPAFPRRRKR
jgi:hypothetical protein